jgi:hypothetical protein
MMRGGYYVVSLVVSTVLLAVGGVLYTGWSVDRSNRKFCTVVGTTVQGYRDAPPTTDVGRTQQRNFERLYDDLGCE